MPVFEYKGLLRDGRATKGIIDADNLRTARTKLKKDGIFVSDISDKKKSAAAMGARKKRANGGKSVNVKDLSLMTRQLATLIKSNIPLVDALGAVSEQVDNPVLQEVLSDIRNNVNEGGNFHKSLAKYPNIFSNIYVSMCEAGEMSGTLDNILIRLAEFTEAQNELQAKVKGALTYPVLMLTFTTGLMFFLFTVVIPKMTTVFESMSVTLPWYTQAIIDFSGFMVGYWYLVVGAFALIYLMFQNWKKGPKGKTQWDSISLSLPLFGDLNRLVAISRFTRTLATLLTGGVPMLTAMQIVRNVVDNDIIAQAVDDARSNISEGESIAGPLKKSGQFPPIVIHMVSIGEKTGELENMLLQVAEAYDFQVKNKIETLTGLMGPVVLIIMGGVVGAIVLAVMVPMFEMINALG